MTIFYVVFQFRHFLVRSYQTCLLLCPILPCCRYIARHSSSSHRAGAGVGICTTREAFAPPSRQAGSVKQLTHILYTAVVRAPCPGCPGLGTFRCWPRNLPVDTLTAVRKAACHFFLWLGYITRSM